MRGRKSQIDADDLIERYSTGESLNALCERYGTDRRRILGILDERGVKPRSRREAVRLASIIDVDTVGLIGRYATGESVHSLAGSFGVDQYVVRRVLREGGVTLRTAAESRRLARTVHVDEPEVIRRYVAGESAHALAAALGCSERVICRVLRDNGVTMRTKAAANSLVLDRLTLEQRTTRATRHAITWEGRSYPHIPVMYPEGSRKRAAGREQTRQCQKPEELAILALLPDGWPDGQQVAVDRYNIDFTSGAVAVEVHSTALHPFRSESNVSRAVDLAELGWHVVYFWPKAGARRVTAGGIAELIAHAERLNRNPSSQRQYMVIRGGGELVTAGRFDLEQRSLVPAPVDADQAADGLDARIAG